MTDKELFIQILKHYDQILITIKTKDDEVKGIKQKAEKHDLENVSKSFKIDYDWNVINNH